MHLLYDCEMSIPVLFLAVALSAVFPQVVRIGPSDPDYCYKIETIRPNLVLRGATHVTGSVLDQTGGVVQNSRIELRRYISQRKQVTVRVVPTDDSGHFDLGTVHRGNYRLLASPHRGFKQPLPLPCNGGKNCELEIVLFVNPTDQLDSSCPIR
jgi:hypothetical protein